MNKFTINLEADEREIKTHVKDEQTLFEIDISMSNVQKLPETIKNLLPLFASFLPKK